MAVGCAGCVRRRGAVERDVAVARTPAPPEDVCHLVAPVAAGPHERITVRGARGPLGVVYAEVPRAARDRAKGPDGRGRRRSRGVRDVPRGRRRGDARLSQHARKRAGQDAHQTCQRGGPSGPHLCTSTVVEYGQCGGLRRAELTALSGD